MPRSSVSLESLSSPSPTPPPPKQRASPPPQNNHDPAGLDSGSELSELTEDEQDSTETKSKTSIRKQPTRRTRRSLIPDQMWGWYKKKSLSEEKSKPSEPPDSSNYTDHRNGVDERSKSLDNDDDPDDAPDSPQGRHDQPQPPPANSPNKPSNDSDSDSEQDQSERPHAKVRKPVPHPEEDSDSESEPSEVEDEDDGEGEGTESEDEDEEPSPESNFPGETVTPEELETPNPELADDTNMEVDIVPIVPAAVVAAASIMAGNTVIDSPSPPSSASTSRSPTPAPVKVEKTKRVVSPGKDVPDASVPPEDGDRVADEEEGDPELEEAEMQPAHRAEALDVLATIELKFALLREKLYVEKMEALAWEEALVANGTSFQQVVCIHFHARILIVARPQVSTPNLSISTRNCQNEGTNGSNWPLDDVHMKLTTLRNGNAPRRTRFGVGGRYCPIQYPDRAVDTPSSTNATNSRWRCYRKRTGNEGDWNENAERWSGHSPVRHTRCMLFFPRSNLTFRSSPTHPPPPTRTSPTRHATRSDTKHGLCVCARTHVGYDWRLPISHPTIRHRCRRRPRILESKSQRMGRASRTQQPSDVTPSSFRIVRTGDG